MKRILIFFLTLLSLTALGQQNIKITGVPVSANTGIVYSNGLFQTDVNVPLNISVANLRASTTLQYTRLYYLTDTGRQGTFRPYPAGHSDDGGIYLHDGLGNTWQRIFTGPINPVWFGADPTGTNNSTAAVQSMVNDASGYNIQWPAGLFLVDSVSIPQWTGVNMYGAGLDSTEIRAVNRPQLFFVVGDQKNVIFHDMKWSCMFTESGTDFGHGLYYSASVHTKHVEFYNIRWYAPNAGITALNILVQTGGYVGSWDDVNIHDNIFDSVGQSAISLLNRDTVGIGALVASTANGSPLTVISQTGLDSGKNFRIVHNRIGNLGVSPSPTFGIALTLDGNGYNGIVSDNTIYNCLNEGLENTGYWYVDWRNNIFEKALSGRNWEAWAFGGQNKPIYYNTISYNKELEVMNVIDGFTLLFNSKFDHNILRSQGGVQIQNSSNNTFDQEYYYSTSFYTFRFLGFTGICTGNIMTACTLDHSPSSVGTSVVVFDGSTSYGNYVKDTRFIKSSNNDPFTSYNRGAFNNYVSNPINGITNNPVVNSYDSITVTNGARDTIRNVDADIIDFKFYKLRGTITSPGSVWFTSPIHRDITIYNANAFPDSIFNVANANSFVVVQPGAVQRITSDSVNLYNQTGVFPGWYVAGNYVITDSTKHDTVCNGCNQTSLLPTAITETYFRETVNGGTNNVVAYLSRIANNAHDTMNAIGFQSIMSASGADSMTSSIGFQVANISSGVFQQMYGYQALGGNQPNVHGYTEYFAANATLAAGSTLIGFEANISRAANTYAFYSPSTAVSYHLGGFFIGSATPDSVYELHVSRGQSLFDSAVTISGEWLKVTGADSVIGNSYTSGTGTFIGNLSAKSITGDSLFLSNTTLSPLGFATIYYSQNIAGGTSNPIGLDVRVSNNAHDTTNMIGIQSEHSVSGSDSSASWIGFRHFINASGFMASAIGVQSAGGTLPNLQSYTHFQALNATIAGSGTEIGFQSGISAGANKYAYFSNATAVSRFGGGVFIGVNPDSTNKLRVFGIARIDSLASVGTLSTSLGTTGGSYSMGLNDFTIIYTGSSGTLTLPSVTGNTGRLLILKHTTTGVISLSGTIGSGDQTYLNPSGVNGSTLVFQCDGTSWWAIASGGGSSATAQTVFTPTTGSTVTVNDLQYNVINPAGSLVALTLVFPSSPNNGDFVTVTFEQAITTVTYPGNVSGGIVSPALGTQRTWVWNAANSKWF